MSWRLFAIVLLAGALLYVYCSVSPPELERIQWLGL
jgi:hypothetical protein